MRTSTQRLPPSNSTSASPASATNLDLHTRSRVPPGEACLSGVWETACPEVGRGQPVRNRQRIAVADRASSRPQRALAGVGASHLDGLLLGLQIDAHQDLPDLFEADGRVPFVKRHQLLDQPVEFHGDLVVVAAEDPFTGATCLTSRLFPCQAGAQEQAEAEQGRA